MWQNASQQSIISTENDNNNTGTMLQYRCPNCGCAEEEAVEFPSRFQRRLLCTARVISLTLVLLFGMVMALLALVLFGSPVLLRQSEPKKPHMPSLPEAVSEKQLGDKDLTHPSVLLTISNKECLEWQHENGHVHRRGGFIYSNGNLTVPTEGLYRIYLQITFEYKHKDDRPEEACQDYDEMLFLWISVQYYSNSYKKFVPLLVSQDTMSCRKDWNKSMYTSGTFELEAHSLLKLDLRHEKLIQRKDAQAFFGVELLHR